MRKIFVYFLMLMIGLIAFILCGCGKKSTTPDNTAEIDLEGVSTFVGEGNLGFDMSMVEISYALIDQHFEGGGLAKIAKTNFDVINSLQIFTHDSSNYWHIFACSAVLIGDFNDTMFFNGVDSIRFSDSSGYTYFPDSSIDGIDTRWHFNAEFANAFQNFELASHAALEIGIDGYEDPDILLNGTTIDSIDVFMSDSIGYCDMGMYFDQTMTNIAIDSLARENSGCPSSGRIDLGFSIAFECEGDADNEYYNMNGAFTGSIVFNDGSVTITLQSGGNSYTETTQCSGGSPLTSAVGKFRN